MGPPDSHSHVWVKSAPEESPLGSKVQTLRCLRCGGEVTRIRFVSTAGRTARGGMSRGFDGPEGGWRYIRK